MIDTPHITQTSAQGTAVIRLTVPRSEIQKVMSPAIGEVLAVVNAQGLKPVGPVFTRHFRMDPQVFDFEVGVPVATTIQPAGRVIESHLPAARVARTVYRGPYQGLGEAWHEFDAWLTTNEHHSAQDLWESYVAGPETGPDSSQWRTELTRPLL